MTTRRVFTFPDRSQVLIVTWDDGTQQAARRDLPWETWGPPAMLDHADDDEPAEIPERRTT